MDVTFQKYCSILTNYALIHNLQWCLLQYTFISLNAHFLEEYKTCHLVRKCWISVVMGEHKYGFKFHLAQVMLSVCAYFQQMQVYKHMLRWCS